MIPFSQNVKNFEKKKSVFLRVMYFLLFNCVSTIDVFSVQEAKTYSKICLQLEYEKGRDTKGM